VDGVAATLVQLKAVLQVAQAVVQDIAVQAVPEHLDKVMMELEYLIDQITVQAAAQVVLRLQALAEKLIFLVELTTAVPESIPQFYHLGIILQAAVAALLVLVTEIAIYGLAVTVDQGVAVVAQATAE
jgi:hypothetical protein